VRERERYREARERQQFTYIHIYVYIYMFVYIALRRETTGCEPFDETAGYEPVERLGFGVYLDETRCASDSE